MAQLSHPAIVADLGVLRDAGSLWVWRADIDGTDPQLADLEQRLALVQRLTEALGQIHGAGLGHGDLDIAHLIVTPSDGVKLVDCSYQNSATPAQDMLNLGRLLFQWETRRSAGSLDSSQLAAALAGVAAERALPPRLSRLIVRLLAADGVSALEASEELEDIRLSLSRADAQVLAHWKTETIEPVAAPAVASGPVEASSSAYLRPEVSEPTPSRTPVLLATAAALVLVLGIIFVARFLPQRISPPETAEPAVVQAPAPLPPAAEPPAPLSQADLERLLQQREQAQEVLDEFINLRLELEQQKVERWAERSFEAAVATAAKAEEPFRAQAFERALQLYSDALRQLRGVSGLRPLVVAEALERGTAALNKGLGKPAEDAFSLALSIEPDNALAAASLARTQTLDQVIDLMDRAVIAREQQQLNEAQDLLQQVIALDPLTENASELLSAVNAQLADGRFRAAMSEGLAALAGGSFGAARQALNRAAAMRPDSQAPKDALTELKRRERDSQVSRDSALALSAVEQERWEAAIKHFQDILRQDPNSRQAQEGLSQASERLDLEQRLLAMLNDPSVLWSDKGRAESRSLLYDARSFQASGPRLADQLSRLESQIDLAAKPQQVTIESDSACNVVVYKVARLGQFDQQQLDLLPGRYTAVGTRDGYRDVRVEFMVPAGKAAEPVQLRCQEQVLARG